MGLGGTKTVIGDHHHPAGLQTLMESHQTQRNNRDQHYCIVKSTDHPPGGGGVGGQGEDPVRYKTIDSTGLSYLYISYHINNTCYKQLTHKVQEKVGERRFITKITIYSIFTILTTLP